MTKEYHTLSIESNCKETEDKLNKLAEEGWKLICSYSWHNYYLIMERDKKICSKCKK